MDDIRRNGNALLSALIFSLAVLAACFISIGERRENQHKEDNTVQDNGQDDDNFNYGEWDFEPWELVET